jgi:phosphatidate cytidylyltransferase
MSLTVHELLAALNSQLPRLVRFVVYLAAPALVMSAYWGGSDALLAAFVASALLVLTIRLPLGQDGYVSQVARAIFVLAYGPLFASFAVLLVTSENGVKKVMALVLLTVATDLGGYAAGVLFGAHPMAPKISPKKSWEGFAGAMLVQVTTGVLLWLLVFHGDWWKGALVGLLMVITATIGDLIESMIKRDLGIKDMSALLPGHGGVMDRLDSLVVNAFIAWALFALFL